ncbi:hypothetical protein [Parvularcula marina]|uniref:CBU_0592 family membrane protein n=1 Tax=Parvularcula marina TaxID=2292771 RepID=UPI0035179C9C
MTGWTPTWPDAVGFVGVALLIGAYAALQTGKLSSDAPAYSAANALAAVLIAFSLLFTFNAASMVIEVFWFAISLIGLYRSLKLRRANKSAQKDGAEE